MKIKILAVVLALVAIGVIYFVVFAGSSGTGNPDPLATRRRECGNGDALKGGDLPSCVELALDLMGRENVPVDDDVARALLKKTCDQAFERGCDFLKRFDEVKLDFLENRCKGATFAPDTKACREVGRRYEESIGVTPRPKNFQTAREFFGKACTLGDTVGCQDRDRIAPN